jgi:hypothetical protein
MVIEWREREHEEVYVAVERDMSENNICKDVGSINFGP